MHDNEQHCWEAPECEYLWKSDSTGGYCAMKPSVCHIAVLNHNEDDCRANPECEYHM